jgi:NADH-quinone oxidoreductase subunit B
MLGGNTERATLDQSEFHAPGWPRDGEWGSGGDRRRAEHPMSRVESVLAWARSHSIFVHPFVTSCCALDLGSLFGPRYNLDRLGVPPPESAPRQADLLLVAGPVSWRQESILRRAHAQMAEPRWVMAIGACACSGGPYDGYGDLRGVDGVVPVDVFVPGCPPRPEAVQAGLLELQHRIRSRRPRGSGRPHAHAPAAIPHTGIGTD